jgi:hypothetical protein
MAKMGSFGCELSNKRFKQDNDNNQVDINVKVNNYYEPDDSQMDLTAAITPVQSDP